MYAYARLIWGVLAHPGTSVKGVVERPPFGFCLALLAGTSLFQAFLTPADDRGGYPLWLWIVCVVLASLALSFGLTLLTWVWARMLRGATPYIALFCVGQLCAIPVVPAIPLYPLMKGSWAGFQAWNLLMLPLLVWSGVIFVQGLKVCSGSHVRKALGMALPALAVTWGLSLWGWIGEPTLEGAYPWASRDSARVRVYYPGRSPAEEVGRVAAGCDGLLQKVSRVLEVQPPEFRTGIFLFPNDRLHRKAVPNQWADATAFAHAEAISLVYAPWSEIRDTLTHEVGHVVSIHRIAPDLSLQPLLCEGLAEYVRDALTIPSGQSDKDPLYITTETPLRTLSRVEVFYDAEAMGIGGHNYPHAGSFVRYLIAEHGLDRFKRLCREATDGGPWAEPVEELEKAMQSVYGQSLGQAELAWRSAQPQSEPEERQGAGDHKD